MQQERVRISGFAGLDGAEIDLGRLNLFIGPQASGKSVVAKLLYFVKSFCDAAVDAISQGNTVEDFREIRVRQFDRFFPPAFRSLNGFQIEYSLDGKTMAIEGGKSAAVTINAPDWERLYAEAFDACKQAKESLVKNSLTSQMAIADVFQCAFGRSLPTPQVFIPDGRGNQSTFEDLLKSAAIKDPDLFDPFMVDYQRAYSWANRSLARVYPDWWNAFDSEMVPVLRGTPVEKDGETYVRTADGRVVLLSFASSGQREVFPILKILSYFSSPQFDQQAPTVYLEEPEAHLFPESQVHLVNLIALLSKRSRALQGVITTHSPYVAASLNNLLYAGQLGTLRNLGVQSPVAAVVPEERWLLAANFRAYRFGDGHVADALEPETGLIQADIIDSASNETGAVFDRLVELDDRR